MQELKEAVNLIEQAGNSDQLVESEAKGLLKIITNYTQSFILLNQFDSNNLPEEKLNGNITYEIEYDEAVSYCRAKEATDQKERSFRVIWQ